MSKAEKPNIKDSKVGIVGDGATVEGGIHFHSLINPRLVLIVLISACIIALGIFWLRSKSEVGKAQYYLNNNNGLTLVTEIPGLKNAMNPAYHVCKAVAGTSVEPLNESVSEGPIEFVKVRITTGDCKGKIGWVSKGVLKYR